MDPPTRNTDYGTYATAVNNLLFGATRLAAYCDVKVKDIILEASSITV